MYDPFEESLRDLLKSSSAEHDDDATLGRVLKTANRQVGVGDLFVLLGRGLEFKHGQAPRVSPAQ